MKESEFISHLQHMIEEHWDLPLVVLEVNDYNNGYSFIELDGIEYVYNLEPEEFLYNDNDYISKERKVFLID